MKHFYNSLILLIALVLRSSPGCADDSILSLDNRRELFVDSHLIETYTGSVELKLHQPRPREIALRFDRPWEGNTSGYPTVMHDGEVYRMIYRGHRMSWDSGKLLMANSPVVCFYTRGKSGSSSGRVCD